MAKKSKRRHTYTRRTDEQRLAELEAELQDMLALTKQFSPEAVVEERARLGLSAAAYGDLVGVAALTIYSWEHGRRHPRRPQLDAWLAVKGIDEDEAWERLGIEAEHAFDGEQVAAERARLELSAANYGELVGVSGQTIYSWEKGRTAPQKAQLQKWLAVKGIDEDEAWERLGIEAEPAFSGEQVAAERERLELSAADYGELVGVSGLTIYNWEKGRTSPRQAQLEKWLAVRGIGKRKAWKALGYA